MQLWVWEKEAPHLDDVFYVCCPLFTPCFFLTWGGASLLQVMTDPATGESKGYGFVRFYSREDRDRCVG